MNSKVMVNKEEISDSATLNHSRLSKIHSTKLVRDKIRTNIATSSNLLQKLKVQSKERRIPVRFLSEIALKEANAEILENCFGGISPEEFLSRFPQIDNPEKEYDAKTLIICDYATHTVAGIFAAASNQTYSDYCNNAIWKALANFSLARLKDSMRQRYG